MNEIKIGSKVWCNTGKPSYDYDGNFVGSVVSIHEDKYVVSKITITGKEERMEFRKEQLIPLCFCPINNRADLNTDWIDEYLVKHGYGDDNNCIGWIYRSGDEYDKKYDVYPVRYSIIREEWLKIERFQIGLDVFRKAINIINDLFNCEPDLDIVAEYKVEKDALFVKFYYLLTE